MRNDGCRGDRWVSLRSTHPTGDSDFVGWVEAYFADTHRFGAHQHDVDEMESNRLATQADRVSFKEKAMGIASLHPSYAISIDGP